MSAFDPYQQWLGISDAVGTPNHYRLLGLRLFEDAPSAISTAASRLTDEINGHRYGLHGPEARRILQEIEAARECLLNPSSKATYDAELRKHWGSAPPNPIANPSREARGRSSAPPASVTWHSAGPAMPLPPGSPLPPGVAPPSQPSPPASPGRAGGPPSISATIASASTVPLPPGAKAAQPVDDVLLPPTASGSSAAMPTPPSSYASPSPPSPAYPAPPPPTSYPAPPGTYPAAPAYPAASPYPVPAVPMGYPQAPNPQNYGYPTAAVPVAPVVPQAAAVAIPMAPPAAIPTPVYGASVHSPQATMPVAQAVPAHVSTAPPPAAYEAEPELFTTRSRFAWRRQKTPSAGMILGAATVVLVAAAMIVFATNQPEAKTRPEPTPQIARSQAEPKRSPEKLRTAPPPATPEAKIEPLPSQEAPKPMMEEKPAPAVVAPPAPKPAPAPPKPTPPPPKPVPTVPDAQKDAAVTTALNLARAAISKNDPSTARTQVDAARKAMAPNRDTEIDRIDALANYMGEFNKAMKEGIKGLEVGGQFTIKDTIVGVVEASSENLILRDAGMNKTFSMRNLPPEIAYALAESWLNKSDATSKIILGTYQAMHPQGNRTMARQLWNIAAADGAKEMAELLLPELSVPLAENGAPAAMADDSKPGADGRLKLPTASALGQARKDVQQAFQADYDAAKDAATMGALSAKLLERAEQPSDTAAVRYILLLEAGRFAAAAGEFDRMAVALDKLGERYTADPLELKIDLMFESSKHIEGKMLNEALATAALALCDEAVLSDKLDLAQKIVRTAKSAATKSGNAELGKQCSSREKDIKELKK